MKKIIITVLTFSIGLSVFAQTDSVRATKEIGLVFSSLNSFGLSFKIGNENTLFRVTALSLTGSSNSSSYNNYNFNGASDTIPNSPASSLGVGLNFGIEKRKHISPKFYFYYGLVLVNSYTESKSTVTTPTPSSIGYFVNGVYNVQSAISNSTVQNNTWGISSGLGVVLGVAYKLSHSFTIAAELIPSVSYSYSETKSSTSADDFAWGAHTNLPYTLYEYTAYSSSDKITKGITCSVLNSNAAITIIYKLK